jgi:hypothetical protein
LHYKPRDGTYQELPLPQGSVAIIVKLVDVLSNKRFGWLPPAWQWYIVSGNVQLKFDKLIACHC